LTAGFEVPRHATPLTALFVAECRAAPERGQIDFAPFAPRVAFSIISDHCKCQDGFQQVF
jgi:hypothetical protein